jgi:lysophospholipase L1-like esterase
MAFTYSVALAAGCAVGDAPGSDEATTAVAADSASLAQVAAIPTLHTIGDSTVALWAANQYPKVGWGQDLQLFLDPAKVIVKDQAVSGTSAKSFYDATWPSVKATIRPGDFVTIQFGINDAAADAARHTIPFTTFKDYLTKFCNETSALGAHPILVATVNRNTWRDGVIYPAYHDYPIATRQLAAALHVPLIDLDQAEGALRTSLGEAYSVNYFSMVFPAGQWSNFQSGSNDNVHFQESGVLELDNLVIDGIRALHADPFVNTLIPAIRPTHRVEVLINDATLGMVTRTQSVPAGVKFTLLAIPNAGHRFMGWTGDVAGTAPVTQFTMGNTSRRITGNFR